MHPAVLNELRLLSSMQFDSRILLTVVLAGDACVFQTNPATDSVAKLPPIPRQSCH
jgi:hypothetical protein